MVCFTVLMAIKYAEKSLPSNSKQAIVLKVAYKQTKASVVNRYMPKLLTSLLMVGALLAGCAVNPVSGRPMLTLVSEDAEFDLGHDIVQAEIKEYGLYEEMPKLTTAYRDLGQEIVAISERPDKPFDFLMIDSDTFNAWAVPGYVNVYRGILPFLNSRAELAALMGHEVGHITARHTVRNLTVGTLAQVGLIAGSVIVAATTDNDALGNAVLIGGSVAASAGISAYSRRHEFESDDLGARYLDKLGYAPEEATFTFETLGRMNAFDKKLYEYIFDKERPQPLGYHVFASHPESEDRVARLVERYGKPELRPARRAPAFGNDTTGRAAYLNLIDGLAYGPDMSEGVAGRDTLYFPEDGYQVGVPGDMLLVHGMLGFGGNWVGINPDEKRAFTAYALKLKDKYSLEEAMRLHLTRARNFSYTTLPDGTKILEASLESDAREGKEKDHSLLMLIPGAKIDDKDKDGDELRRFHVLRLIAQGREVSDADKQAFAQIKNLYKSLSKEQVAGIEPLRIKIHTVQSGESVAELADRLPFGALREDYFRLLNNLEEGEELKTGAMVKLIVDPNA